MDKSNQHAESNRLTNVAIVFLRPIFVLIDLTVVLVGLIALFAFAARFLWAAEMCCQFRVQLLIFLMPTALLYCLFRQGRVAWFALACLAANMIPLSPYLLPTSPIVVREGVASTRLLMLNVLVNNVHYEEVCDYVQQQAPDLFFAIEADQGWTIGLKKIRTTYPHRYLIDGRGTSSIAVYSRLPFDDIETHFSTKHRLPSIDMTLTLQGKQVQIFATHPYIPLYPETAKLRNEQFNDVANSMDADRPRILLGDFNCTPWSPFFRNILKTANVSPAGYGQGLEPTWYRRARWYGPFRKTWVFALKLDHVLLSDDFMVTHHEIGPCLGSDHRPVTVDFVLVDESD